MSVLDVKLRRDLIQSRSMLLAIVAIVAVGVSCLVGFQGVSRNLQSSKRDYYDTCRMAEFWIDLKKAPLAELGPAEAAPGTVLGLEEGHLAVACRDRVYLLPRVKPACGSAMATRLVS